MLILREIFHMANPLQILFKLGFGAHCRRTREKVKKEYYKVINYNFNYALFLIKNHYYFKIYNHTLFFWQNTKCQSLKIKIRRVSTDLIKTYQIEYINRFVLFNRILSLKSSR